MARSQTRRYSALGGKDEPIEKAFIESSNILMLFPAQIPALGQVFTPDLGLLDIYTNVDLQKAIKLALELFI